MFFPGPKEKKKKEKKKKNNHLRLMQINHKEPDEAVIPLQSWNSGHSHIQKPGYLTKTQCTNAGNRKKRNENTAFR